MEALARYKFGRFLFLDVDPDVHDRAKRSRASLYEAIKTNNPEIVLRVLEEEQMNINMGITTVLNWSNLNDEQVMQMAKDILESSASPQAIEKSDSEMDSLKAKLGLEGDKEFYERLAKGLGIKKKRMWILSNPMLGQDISQYRGRLNKFNLVRKHNPQIGRISLL